MAGWRSKSSRSLYTRCMLYCLLSLWDGQSLTSFGGNQKFFFSSSPTPGTIFGFPCSLQNNAFRISVPRQRWPKKVRTRRSFLNSRPCRMIMACRTRRQEMPVWRANRNYWTPIREKIRPVCLVLSRKAVLLKREASVQLKLSTAFTLQGQIPFHACSWRRTS